MILFQRIKDSIFFLVLSLLISSCATNDKKIEVSILRDFPPEPYPCQKISEVKVIINDGIKRNENVLKELLKEESANVGATHLQVIHLKRYGYAQGKGIAYNCINLENENQNDLEKNCLNSNANACMNMAFQLSQDGQKNSMDQLNYFVKSCNLGDKKSCEQANIIKEYIDKLNEQKKLKDEEDKKALEIANLKKIQEEERINKENQELIKKQNEEKKAKEIEVAYLIKIRKLILENLPKCESGLTKICWGTYLKLKINNFKSADYFLEKGCEFGHEKSCIVLQTKMNKENGIKQIELSKLQIKAQLRSARAQEDANLMSHMQNMRNELNLFEEKIKNALVPQTQTCRTMMELGVMVTRCN